MTPSAALAIPPFSSSATFCYCHHLVHSITSTLGQYHFRSALILLHCPFCGPPIQHTLLWVYCFIRAMLICHLRVWWQQIYHLGSAVYSEPPCFPMLSLPGSLYLQVNHTQIHLLAHFKRSNLLQLNCFIRAVLVWPPHRQTNAAILVSLVGPNYSGSAVFQSCSWLTSHLPSHVACIFSCLHDQQLNYFIIATIIWSSHISLALRLLGDAPTRPAYSFC